MTDQFESEVFEVNKIKSLYDPTDEDGEGVIDPLTGKPGVVCDYIWLTEFQRLWLGHCQ